MSAQLARNSYSIQPPIPSSDHAQSSSLSRQRTRSGRQFQSSESLEKKPPRSHHPGEDNRIRELESDDVVFLRLPEVKAMTGLSKSSLYALIREKTFPAPVRLGPRAVAWVKSEVTHWAMERVRQSRVVA